MREKRTRCMENWQIKMWLTLKEQCKKEKRHSSLSWGRNTVTGSGEQKWKERRGVGKRAERLWQRGDMFGEVESGLIWYDGVPLSPHRRAPTAAKKGPMHSSVMNVILCGVAIASGWCEGGWTESPAVFEYEGQTTTHLNHMDVFQQLKRAFVRCMHACMQQGAL